MNRDQPALRSANVDVGLEPRSRLGMRTPSRIAADSSHDAASTARAQPELKAPTITAAAEGPQMVNAPRIIATRTLACWRCPRGPRFGTTLDLAGWLPAKNATLRALRATSRHSSARPVCTRLAPPPC